MEPKRESQRDSGRSSSADNPPPPTTASFRIPRVKKEPGVPRVKNESEDVKPSVSQPCQPPSQSCQQPPSFPPAYVPFSRRQSEPQICQYWLEGNCPKSASECPFDHEGQVENIFEKCKFYLSKGCKKGKACPFLHELFPCKKFHLMGSCDDSPCGFSHDPLTEQTRPLFQEVTLWIWV